MKAMFNMSADDPDPCRRRLSFWSTFNSPLHFDTSSVVSMAGMFQGASAFNQPLSFDTSSVTDMSQMFQGATAYNQPLSFDTSKVTDMSRMFEEAWAYDNGANPNQVVPVTLDTSKVTDMSAMFKKATTFDQPLSFDTSQVTNMEDMFLGASAFDQSLDFDFIRVRNMKCMLAEESCQEDLGLLHDGRRAQALSCPVENATLVFNQPIDLGTARSLTDVSGMFAGSKFNQPVSLNTSDVTNMKAMFRHASWFNQPLSFDTARVTDMSDMFEVRSDAPLHTLTHTLHPDSHASSRVVHTFPLSILPRAPYTSPLRLARHRARQTLTSH